MYTSHGHRSWNIPSHSRPIRVLASAIACTAFAAIGLAQTDYPESEPNQTKATATIVEDMTTGDSVVGVCTGTATTATSTADNTQDYFRIGTVVMPGIVRHRLVLRTTGPVGHSVTLRGLGQNASGYTGTEAQCQPSLTNVDGSRSIQWYALGPVSRRFYVRITGQTTSTATYRATLETAAVTPTDLGLFPAGTITITTTNLGPTADTDLWVYDGDGSAISGYGNDNVVFGTSQSTLVRTYDPGTYYIALSDYDLMNNLFSPQEDANHSGKLMDFPGVTACASSLTGVPLSMRVSVGSTVRTVNTTKVAGADVLWFKFVIPGPPPPGCNAADVVGIGGNPPPDGLLTGDDFNAFIGAFASSSLLADITGIGGPPSAADGLVTGDDFNAFIALFAAGCP